MSKKAARLVDGPIVIGKFFRIPVWLENVVICLYISAACGQDGEKESGTVGLVPKRK